MSFAFRNPLAAVGNLAIFAELIDPKHWGTPLTGRLEKHLRDEQPGVIAVVHPGRPALSQLQRPVHERLKSGRYCAPIKYLVGVRGNDVEAPYELAQQFVDVRRVLNPFEQEGMHAIASFRVIRRACNEQRVSL